MIPLETFGVILATIGSIISVIGSLYNNLWHNHLAAMKIWGYGSNPLLLIWSLGLCLHLWDGGLSAALIVRELHPTSLPPTCGREYPKKW